MSRVPGHQKGRSLVWQKMDLSHFQFGEIVEISSRCRWSGPQLLNWVEQRAHEWMALQPPSRGAALIYTSNSAVFFVDLLACWRLGFCAIPMDATAPARVRQEWEQQLAPALIVEPNGTVRKRTAEPSLWPEEFALGLLSSGSSGPPRLTLHTCESLQRKMETLAKVIPLNQIQNTLCALPVHFGHGLVCNSLFPWLMGSTLHLQEGFTPAFVAALDEMIEAYRISFFSSTPVVWGLLEQFGTRLPKPGLRRIHCASAPLDERRAETMRAWSGPAELWNVYGLTEFLGWVSGSRFERIEDCTRVGAGWDTEISIDPANSEVRLKAPFMMRASRALNALDVEEELRTHQETEFWRTGDAGRWNGGNLVLTGRIDFQINKAGLKIQPEEIEMTAQQAAGVADVACTGFEDPIWGSKVGLLVCVRNGQTVHPETLRAWLAERLPAYKVPDLIRVVERLPRTSRGKLERHSLRDLANREFRK
ncbi:MAG: class I adenylate-forming enzyme family protein [Bdellovibrionales bacterium]